MRENFKVPVKLKLSALWASVMFLYIYADYFELYMPGKLEEMAKGTIGPFKVTDDVMLGVSAIMVAPSVMIFLSLVLPPVLSRWINAVLGLGYSAIVFMTMRGAAPFWIFFCVVEITLTLLIVWYALTWPKQPPAA